MENDLDELFEPGTGEEKNTATVTAKCPQCGANLIFDAETQGLKCPYCGDTKKLDMDNYSSEIDFKKLFEGNKNQWGAETRVFRCKNCGATTVISRKDIAKDCAFCGTSNVVETDEMSGLKPNAVLPFTVTKDQAGNALKVWAKKRIFSPRDFKKSVEPEKLQGNYLPCFTFDSHTESKYRGELGEYYYVTRTVNGKQVSERKVRYFHISGSYTMDFDDVIVHASDKVPEKAMNKLNPFDTGNSQEYSENFLLGFTATQYTKSGEECWKQAKGIMYEAIKRKVLSQYNYDIVVSFDMDTNYYNVTYKYVLIPLYVGHYKYKEKLFNFFVNGRNAKVTGQAPKSVPRILLAVLGGLICLVGIVLLILYYGGYI